MSGLALKEKGNIMAKNGNGWTLAGKNVETRQSDDGKYTEFRVLNGGTYERRPSDKPAKTIPVATTGGNIPVPVDGDVIYVGLNAYRK